MASKTNWLGDIVGPWILRKVGVDYPQRPVVELVEGDGVSIAVEDVPDDAAVRLTISATADGVSPIANTSTGTLNDVTSLNSGSPTGAIRFSGAAPVVNGITNGTPGRKLVLEATGGPLVLAHEAGASTAANRIVTSTGSSVTIPNGAGVLLVYDNTSSRWRIAGGGAGGSSPGGSDGDVQVKSGTGLAGKTLTAGDGARVTSDSTHLFVHGVRATCSLEQFGAVGDGVTSDQTAIAAAFAALSAGTYNTLVLGAKTYLGTWGQSVPGGCSIVGQGHLSVLKQTGATAAVLLIGAVNDITLRDFKIVGDGTATIEAYGVKMGTPGGASSGPQRVTLNNILVSNCWAGGFLYVNNPKTNFEGPMFIGCRVSPGGNYGFKFDEQGEYATLVGCKVDGNAYGIWVAAGNITCIGCDFTSNTTGVRLATGTNDAHGVFSGCSINHNSTCNVLADAIVNGHTFDGCHIYGSNIQLVSSIGVVFSSCIISAAGLTLSFDGSTGTRFIDCTVIGSTTIVDNANSHPSSTQWINCRDLDGSIPASVAARVQLVYTFSSDANQTLTLQQSEAESVIVASGTLTATRTLTIAIAPGSAVSRRVRFVNNNSQQVNVQWSSGSSVAVSAGYTALVGSDGTNAIILDAKPAGGEANTSSNSGTGAQLAQAKSGANLPFRSIIGSSPIVATQNTNDVTLSLSTVPIASGGTALTAVPGSSGNPIINSSSAYGAATNWTMGTGFVGGAGSYISLGATPGSSGDLRVTAGFQITSRVGGVDRPILQADAGAQILIGDTTTGGNIINRTQSGQSIFNQIAGSNCLTISATDIKHGSPVAGDSGGSAPFRWKQATVSSTNTAVTLTAAQYECPFISFTGSISSGPLDFIAPASVGAYLIIETNYTSSGGAYVLKKSGGSGVSLSTAGCKHYIYSSILTDYRQVTN